ncbi:thiolase-like protein [Ephemerocybe angulata]|uniref:Thiolase-like protein n=1 Tax=Ephemerocybe angulata TaxID=980116 RepID=A0A8H6HJU4_9AGAR|nr:thiolase-like protein [Tulosesus angulatus]
MAKSTGNDEALVTKVMSNFKIFGSGGAATSPGCLKWAKEINLPLVIDIGMTEVGGPLFHNSVDDDEGWLMSDCLVPDSQLYLVDEKGEIASDEGELHISSPIIAKGYLRPNYSAFTVGSDGRVTLRTGDIYKLVGDGRIVWEGRKEDFIQMSSGETLDPESSRNLWIDLRPSTVPALWETTSFVQLCLEVLSPQAFRSTSSVLRDNHGSSFAELGMDSAMATKMVRAINTTFAPALPSRNRLRPSNIPYMASKRLSSSVKLSDSPEASMDPEEFWDAMMEKRDDIITPIPEDRWDHASFYRAANSDHEEQPGDITLLKAGFINITDFDHSFFALENANIPVSRLKGSDMGVFVAANMDEGHIKLLFSEKGWGAYTRFYGTGVATSTACGRLSYLLDVHGPSYTIDTACSSWPSVRYLQSGQGESAIVCGANTHSWPGNFAFLSAQKMTSPNSRCATFTNVADGYVPSEGAAAVVLKTKRAALRDGDKILAVVKSTSTMHDGRSQALDPEQVDFVEAHGTGTSLGDLIEVEGINEVFKGSHSFHSASHHRSNGFAGTIAGAILEEYSDAKISLYSPEPMSDRSVSQSSQNSSWCKLDSEKFSLSPSFTPSRTPSPISTPAITDSMSDIVPVSHLFVVSAKSPAALREYIGRYIDFCNRSATDQFESICYTSCVGREHYRYRYACVSGQLG